RRHGLRSKAGILKSQFFGSRKIVMKTFATLLLISVVLSLVATSLAQKVNKPWTEWSKQEADKILENSPWAQTQKDTNTDQMMFSPTSDPRTMGRSSNDASRTAEGATNQAVTVTYFVRFFSARPIREALARQMMLQQKLPDEALAK